MTRLRASIVGIGVLWILMSQAYGQLATIDLCDEWDRLVKTSLNED